MTDAAEKLNKIKEIAERGLENIDQSEDVDDLIDYAKDALKGIINVVGEV